MTRPGAVPPALRLALRPDAPHCYRHCRGAVRAHTLSSPFPGYWQVYACPGGVVSLTSYVELTRRNLSPNVLRFLRARTHPASLVRNHDLRTASRHGPELGRAAERLMARRRPSRPLRVVYWRVYPFRGRDGSEQRLFVCFRHGRSQPVFYPYPAASLRGDCPVCAAAASSGRGLPR